MKYNNVQAKGTKVKKFIIDSWELDENLISKKIIDEKEVILEKDKNNMLSGKEEVIVEKNQQFSFQNIQKIKKNELKENVQEKQEIGGLLESLGNI